MSIALYRSCMARERSRTDSGGTRSQGPIDRFTDIDDLLRENTNRLGDVVSELEKTQIAIQSIDSGSGSESGGADESADGGYPWKFDVDVPDSTQPADPETRVRQVPDGIVRRIEIVSNQAAAQKTGIKVESNDERWVPRNPVDNDSFADDFIPVDQNPIDAFPNIPITDGEEITVSGINTDSSKHYVRVTVYIEEV